MTKEEFMTGVVTTLIEDEFNVFLHAKENLEGCGGWFDCQNRDFLACMSNKMGFEIFVHEYGHYIQWKHFNDFFSKYSNGGQILFGWLDGNDYSDDILDLGHRDSVILELDCETKAVQMIEDNELPVDLDKYKRAANAYLLFYQFVRKNRKWAGKSVYNNEDIMDAMPTELQPLEYYMNPDSISDEVKAYFEDCFIDES